MSEPIDIPYSSSQPARSVDGSVDDSQLTTIAICHYVWGGLLMLLSCIFIIHIVMGLMLLNGRFPANNGPKAPAPEFGYVFICMGSFAMTLGWAVGILTIMSGRAIAQRKWRVFSLVMAGVNCASFPLGTLLGVFTFIVLLRPSVRALYPA